MQKIPSKVHGLWLALLALVILLVLFTSTAVGQGAGNSGGASAREAANPQRQESPGEAIGRLKQVSGDDTQVTLKPATGVAGFVRFPPGRALGLRRGASPQEQSAAFFGEFGRAFGVRDAGSELVLMSSTTDNLGMKHLAYGQVYQGVDVFAAVVRVHLNARNEITAINGDFVPDIALDTNPRLSEAAAAEVAIAVVVAHPPENEVTGGVAEVTPSGLSITSNKLYVYRDGLIQGVSGPDYLVYEVEVTGSGVREFVYVNAHNGKIVNRISGIENDLHRILYEQSTANKVWEEGDPFPGALNQDQQNIVNFSGDSYRFFFNAFGWDSYDNAGAFMRSVNNDPRISCPNANWNGITTNYCNGVTADDVVAHEWGHAYTDFTSDLIYQWQPGALNESYSDIWGEVVDSINGVGTDAPAPVRGVDICSSFTTPVPVLTVNSPASIAGDYAAAGAAFGPQLDDTGVTGDVVLATDGAGSSTTDACEPLTNGADVRGNIALVDRGACNFTVKVKNAQNAGATGVIVANNVLGPPAPMGGADATITIPSIMISLATGNLLKDNLPGVNATMHLGATTTEDSYRWLIGEDATAFGGAIRDMWAPTCVGDPGKVTDEEYQCATSDAGGVHSNSGIPNHAFSLLVDGGTFNGQTIDAIGVVKAAHLFWRAQSTYLGRASDFADFADALETSCSDLIGAPLMGLSTGAPAGPSGEVITAADCTEVSEMIAAVELRVDPTDQCGFRPLLAQNAPALCAGTLSGPATILSDDFEAGLGNWTLTNQGVFSGWPGLDWTQATSLPGGRLGAAAFGIDPTEGNCDLGEGDVSGVMRMESPVIEVEGDGSDAPRLAFDHYVATEFGFDGGNVKISVNGGPYTIVPANAYTFNRYNTTLVTAAGGNTSPLAGQLAFSGTDGGKVTGTWGQSQIDLTRLGVVPGDTIQLRYDMGIDGCTGIDGWYVDDVNVHSCVVEPPVCSGAFASPDNLWPPNHKFQPIRVLGVTDPNDDTIQIIVRGISQDEPVDAPDSGRTSPDGRGVGTSTAEVRAERIESGNGRVYYIDFMARNTVGGTCTGTVQVSVPAERGGTAVGDGALYDSTQP